MCFFHPRTPISSSAWLKNCATVISKSRWLNTGEDFYFPDLDFPSLQTSVRSIPWCPTQAQHWWSPEMKRGNVFQVKAEGSQCSQPQSLSQSNTQSFTLGLHVLIQGNVWNPAQMWKNTRSQTNTIRCVHKNRDTRACTHISHIQTRTYIQTPCPQITWGQECSTKAPKIRPQNTVPLIPPLNRAWWAQLA